MRNPDVTTSFSNTLHHFCRFLRRGWTWRRSPLGPLQTVMILMQMSVFSIRGSSAAMQALFDQVGSEALGWRSVPSDSAFSRARRKAKAEDLRNLLKTLRGECPHVDSHPQVRVAGFNRLAAVDGTKLALCSQGTNKADFGCPSGEHLAPQALLTVLWDVGGNVPIDWRLGRFDDTENAHLDQLIEALAPGDLLLADRLYPSCALMEHMIQENLDFIFRVKTGATSLKAFHAFAQSDEMDRTVEIHGEKPFLIRLVRGHRPGCEDMVFATSVKDHDRLSTEAVADLYQRRWAVETAYREGKDWLALGNLPGRNRMQVEQEVAAVMLYWLLQGELEGQVRKHYAKEIAEQKSIDPKGEPPLAPEITELPVQFRRTIAAVIVGDVIRKGLTSTSDAITIWRVGIDNLWRHRQRRRPSRKYRRTSERPHDIKKRDAISRAQAKGGREKSR